MIATAAIGQAKQDSTEQVNEPIEKWIPKPKKAALLSLIPGGGQIYNRKLAWVKVPIIYGALAGFGYWTFDNQRTFNRFSEALILSVNGEPHGFGNTSQADLRRGRDDFDKFRQRTYIAIGAVYLAQIIESYVAAHLIDFDIEDDLNLNVKLQPIIQQEYSQGVGYGLVLTF